MTATTSTTNFERALAFTQQWEGGFVVRASGDLSHHPNDPGGRTNLGITQATYNQWRRSKQLSPQDVLWIQPQEVKWIYWENYWIPSKCPEMVLPLAVAHFDTAVNFGVGGSTKFLQSVWGVGVDGIWGPITQGAFEKANTKETAQTIVEARIRYRYQRVAQSPSQRVFLQGWLNRDNALLALVRRL
ncbi:MAG: secretion activating protein [Synechococcaceae cyanobacterium SM2_3_1]|nr:secretion activating protein [Synechococcaceae cyanobacterium SM2_3_1]